MTEDYSNARTARAKKFILSEQFYQEARGNIELQIATRGGTIVGYNQGEFIVKKEDLPLLQTVFNRLKDEYPQLNHVRVTGLGEVIFDTKKNTFWRRLNTDYPEF